MPKNSITFNPASALMAMTRKAEKLDTRIVRRRCSGVRCWVKWMKNGTTPIGLTMASSATSGLKRSIRAFCAGTASGFTPKTAPQRTNQCKKSAQPYNTSCGRDAHSA